MHGNPMDIFYEMDEMFTQIFSRMDREFISGSNPVNGYYFTVQDDGEGPEVHEVPGSDAPVPCITGETIAEVHRIGDEVKVIADLPGITEGTLRLGVKGNTLVIDAGDADHHYQTLAVLPPVDISSMQNTLKNGVLEVTFTRLPEPPEIA